ncbi:major facilitator superfamily domain-containing protein [Fusarium sp. MPI-SDFR-AT-0072]|nr:major facilitator superfamily domain-containing protein [Fusarium sp. MPI-SDFR-AT-0072]
MSEEKAQEDTFERVTEQRSPVTGERMALVTEAEEKAVLRKLDLHILPLLFLVYTFSNLDRSNLGNARLAGLTNSVSLEGKRYDWLGTAFYIAWFSTISACQAAVTNYASLVALRVLLGCFEGMFSGVPLYLSFFYPRDKVGFRQGIFLSGSALSNAYGGVLGYAILGIRGSVAPWRYLFLIEGLPVWIVAILAWFHLPDDLLSANFLTDREKEVAWQCVGRGQAVDSQGAGGVSWAEWRSAFLDWRSYVPGLMYFSCNVCFGSLPLFIPTIISEMGTFNHQESNGLSAPPYALCFVTILACAFASDRAKLRGPFVAAPAMVSTVGYCLLGVSEGVAARYAGVFLSVQIFVSISILLPWVSSVHHTESKRAGGWAIFATLGQFGPLVGTNIFPKDQGPYYHKGAWISCEFASLVVLLSITYSPLLRWENKRLDRVMIEDAGVGMEGDDHPRGFWYVV